MSDTSEEQSDYDDGRAHGDWKSRFSRPAWFHIVIEFILLFFYLIGAGYLLIDAVVEKPEELTRDGFVHSSLLGVLILDEVAKWLALVLAGFIGGAVFDLKWLYHSVAKGIKIDVSGELSVLSIQRRYLCLLAFFSLPELFRS